MTGVIVGVTVLILLAMEDMHRRAASAPERRTRGGRYVDLPGFPGPDGKVAKK